MGLLHDEGAFGSRAVRAADGRIVLEVSCGGIAETLVRFALEAREQDRFEDWGPFNLQVLAAKVRKRPWEPRSE